MIWVMDSIPWVRLAHCCTIFLKSSGYRNRNPNINNMEIIWLGNQLPSWWFTLNMPFSACRRSFHCPSTSNSSLVGFGRASIFSRYFWYFTDEDNLTHPTHNCFTLVSVLQLGTRSGFPVFEFWLFQIFRFFGFSGFQFSEVTVLGDLRSDSAMSPSGD